MAFTAIATLVGGAEVTATLVLAAVAEVGTALTIVGAVTGNKDLLKIGGAMALVGGVGGMINGAVSGAGAAGGAAESIESASSLADSAYGGAAAADASHLAGVAEMGGDAGGIISGAQGAETATSLGDAAMPGAPTSSMPATTEAAQPATVDVAPQPTTVNDVTGAQAPQGPAGAQSPTTPYDSNPTDIRLANNTQTAPQSSSNFLKSFSEFAEKNKTLLSSGMQLVGGAMKGASDRDMWNQKMALEQQKVNQTSYGNTVGSFGARPNSGIIGGARA